MFKSLPPFPPLLLQLRMKCNCNSVSRANKYWAPTRTQQPQDTDCGQLTCSCPCCTIVGVMKPVICCFFWQLLPGNVISQHRKVQASKSASEVLKLEDLKADSTLFIWWNQQPVIQTELQLLHSLSEIFLPLSHSLIFSQQLNRVRCSGVLYVGVKKTNKPIESWMSEKHRVDVFQNDKNSGCFKFNSRFYFFCTKKPTTVILIQIFQPS